MKKFATITLIGLFAAGLSAPAMACGGLKTAHDSDGPMTTAMDTKPSTPKPATTKTGS